MRMNILAIDYGEKTIGLAWMQEGLDVVLPFGTLKIQDQREKIKEITALVASEHIEKIVVGLPLTLADGSENSNTKRVREFGAALYKQTHIPVVYVDERLSSFEADEMGGIARRDEKAAMVILKTFQSGLSQE
jgi:putative holliday junction resolvase